MSKKQKQHQEAFCVGEFIYDSITVTISSRYMKTKFIPKTHNSFCAASIENLIFITASTATTALTIAMNIVCFMVDETIHETNVNKYI